MLRFLRDLVDIWLTTYCSGSERIREDEIVRSDPFEELFRTGEYFPDHPVVRKLRNWEINKDEEKNYIPCRKAQRTGKHALGPGTFCFSENCEQYVFIF